MVCQPIQKRAYRSRINWVALAIFVLNGVANEKLWTELIATGVVTQSTLIAFLIQVASGLIIVLRTWCNNQAQEQPGPNTGPTDVYLDENGKPIQVVKGVRE